MKNANPDHLGRHVVVRVACLSAFDSRFWESEVALSEEDKRRAARFKIDQDRRRFILGRWILGFCLREFMEYPAGPLSLILTLWGRPMLTEREDIHFSISHSNELVGVALSIKTLIGLDIEEISRQIHLDELAEKILAPSDLQAFKTIQDSDKRAAFFQSWTGKECYFKAKGTGISEGLQNVSIPVALNSFDPRSFFPEEPQAPAWALQSLKLPEGYLGQVAWDDPRKCLDFRVINPTGD
jgi:4'-phosphopantetheinyl transferase